MTKVNDIYQALIRSGKSEKDAAKEAQARTGTSLVSGKPIRRSPEFKKSGKVKIGQYG